MELEQALTTVAWLTIAKITIGLGLFFVLVGSLYKFKRAILSILGLLLLANLICLYLIIGLLS